MLFSAWSRPVLFVVLFALGLASGSTQGAQARLAVAANFTDAMRALKAEFEKQQSAHRLKISYGSTGKLYAQIEHGAPFDVYLAADTAHTQKAIKQNLALSGSDFVYAEGKLVLYSADPNAFTDGLKYLQAAQFDRLAIANPKTAPYGLAAKQVLQTTKLWDKLQAKLIRGDSIAQTFQFVATENAAAGFVAQAQVMAWKKPIGSMWSVPQKLYSPIKQGLVLLKRGKNNPAAQAFITFLRSMRAKTIIQDFGYAITKNQG